jgi:hypothetical protein
MLATMLVLLGFLCASIAIYESSNSYRRFELNEPTNPVQVIQSSSTPLRAPVVPSSKDEDCPIKNTHPGMLLQNVRSQLAGYVMDYRGLRQDEEVYFVDARTCHAFLDFNSQDGRLDAIDYGLGDDKIEFRKDTSEGTSRQITP